MESANAGFICSCLYITIYENVLYYFCCYDNSASVCLTTVGSMGRHGSEQLACVNAMLGCVLLCVCDVVETQSPAGQSIASQWQEYDNTCSLVKVLREKQGQLGCCCC